MSSGPSTSELILEEVRELRKDLSSFRSETEQRVSVLETQMKPLIDNGQPGRVTKAENRITVLEHWRIYVMGLSAAIAGGVGLLIKLF